MAREGVSFGVFVVSFGAEFQGGVSGQRPGQLRTGRGLFQTQTLPGTWSLCCFMLPSCPSFLRGSEVNLQERPQVCRHTTFNDDQHLTLKSPMFTHPT